MSTSVDRGMERWKGRVALVTGASAGIGSVICKNLARYGMTVVGCARNIAQIEALGKECKGLGLTGKVVAVKCDLSKEQDITEMFKYIETNFNGVDVCINNAGFALPGRLLELTAEDMRAMLDVNVVALTLCSSKAANSMLSRGVNDGHIFLINSMSGHRLTGGFNFYGATKFAVTALTEGFRRELVAKSRIRVTSISPGLVETEFAPRAMGEAGKKWYETRQETILKPQDVVDALLFALSAPENAQIHDILMRPTGEQL